MILPPAQSDWDLYVGGFENAIQQAEEAIKEISTSTGLERSRWIKQANAHVDEANDGISSLQSIAAEYSSVERSNKLEKIERFRQQVKSIQDKIRGSSKVVADNERMRNNLMGGAVLDADLSEIDGISKMKKGTKTLSDGTVILEEAMQTLTNAEDTGVGTLSELSKQRDTLGSAKGHSDGIDTNLSRAGKFLRGMKTRARQNQFILVCVIIVIIAIIGLIVFFIIKNAIDKKKAADAGGGDGK